MLESRKGPVYSLSIVRIGKIGQLTCMSYWLMLAARYEQKLSLTCTGTYPLPDSCTHCTPAVLSLVRFCSLRRLYHLQVNALSCLLLTFPPCLCRALVRVKVLLDAVRKFAVERIDLGPSNGRKQEYRSMNQAKEKLLFDRSILHAANKLLRKALVASSKTCKQFKMNFWSLQTHRKDAA